MDNFVKLKNILNEISLAEEKIKTLKLEKNLILKKLFDKNKDKIINFNIFKNNDILITDNDIVVENDIQESDFEISDEETDEEN